MRAKYFSIILFLLAGVFLIGTLSGDNVSLNKINDPHPLIKSPEVKNRVKPDLNFGNIPLYFTHNKGQVNKRAIFYAKTQGYTLWVTKGGLIFDSIGNKKADIRSKKSEVRSRNKVETSFRDVSRLLFIGANKNIEILPLKEQKLKVNYFKGSDKSKWVAGIPTSGAVLYKNVYKHIDLKVYGIGKQIEYDWIVHPGGDPENIRFEYKNVKDIRINGEGDLDITTQFGKLTHKKPFAYQNTVGANGDSPKMEIRSEFKQISKNSFGFITGEYDRTKPLVIDPLILNYSSHYGGTTSSWGGNGQNWGKDIAVTDNGIAYVAAQTTSIDFPVVNEYDSTFDGDIDVLILKIDTTKSGSGSLVYSSYFGGIDYDYSRGICVDSSGRAYISGFTTSLDFPVQNAYQSSHSQAVSGGYIRSDSFVICIDTTVSGTSGLVYSSYLGGLDNDDNYGISGGDNGIVYLGGYTSSTDFPVKNEYQADQGSDDVYISKFDTKQSGSSSLLYSTYFGGTSWEWGHAIANDNNGIAYVTGVAGGSGLPLKGELHGDKGGWDAFVTLIDTTKSGSDCLVYSTYLGGNDDEEKGYGIAVDGNGYVYVTGYTRSNDFPITNEYQSVPGSSWDAFLTKIDPYAGSAGLLYSTYLGGSDHDNGNGVAVDTAGNAYLTGSTSSNNFPLRNEYMQDQTYDDIFITKINTIAAGDSSLVWSTYLGGNDSDEAKGIDVDSNGVVYITGDTQSTDFPLANEHTGTVSGSDDMFVSKISPNPLTTDHSVQVNAGDYGSVDKENHLVMEGGSVTINVYPDEGFEIDRIVDNGIEMAVSNPYVISDIQEDHTVEISFKKILYPPVLSLTGEKKVEKAWIVQKGYSELDILITEHDSPMIVSSYVLYKNVSGVWSEIKSYSGPGSYEYTDKYFKKGESVDYKLAAIAPDGSVIAETTLNL